MANSVDPDQMPRSVVSDLGQNGLLRPFFSNTYGYYSMVTQLESANGQVKLVGLYE